MACPDTVEKIVRLGCEATTALSSMVKGVMEKGLRIKVARTGNDDSVDGYRVVTKLAASERRPRPEVRLTPDLPGSVQAITKKGSER